ncbi:MAG: M28 family peptidase [Bacteroidales bacterium]|jgi:Zn-dependent M28 family amino/carboxypeptidase
MRLEDFEMGEWEKFVVGRLLGEKEMNQLLTGLKICKLHIICGLLCVSLFGCKNSTTQKPDISKGSETVQIPVFSGDSAWSFVQKQVSFGPRVPGTPAQTACADWLAGKFRSYGADVIVQQANIKVYDGIKVPMKNIIARFQPEKSNRILLMAHWDSRPFADQDPDPAKRDLPIDGANDGGSGAGVLLEIARGLQKQPTQLGIDLILFDVEDYGAPAHRVPDGKPEDWGLGSQYWAKNPHITGYFARYGILLDMVGAPNAVFTMEEVSRFYAQSVLDKVWQAGNNLGYGQYFSYQKTPQLIDDHRFVNEIIGIPSIDIIQNDAYTESSFGSTWHTQSDNLSNINRQTLTAVGRTLFRVIYDERQ